MYSQIRQVFHSHFTYLNKSDVCFLSDCPWSVYLLHDWFAIILLYLCLPILPHSHFAYFGGGGTVTIYFGKISEDFPVISKLRSNSKIFQKKCSSLILPKRNQSRLHPFTPSFYINVYQEKAFFTNLV